MDEAQRVVERVAELNRRERLIRGTGARQARAEIILERDALRAHSRFRRSADGQTLYVPSQQYDDTFQRYRVALDPDTDAVLDGNCPDQHFRHPRRGCKHMRAAREWLRRHRLRV
jgi:hypothetical protein